jgi:hypothetical protein
MSIRGKRISQSHLCRQRQVRHKVPSTIEAGSRRGAGKIMYFLRILFFKVVLRNGQCAFGAKVNLNFLFNLRSTQTAE